MLDFIKIDKNNFPNLVFEGQERYALISDDNKIVGASVIDKNANENKIMLSISDEYRSNGHGKKLFMLTMNEYKNSFDSKDLIFDVESSSNMCTILSQSGGIHISTNNGISRYVLPIENL